MWTALFRVNWKLNTWGGGGGFTRNCIAPLILAVFCCSFFTYFQTLFSNWFEIKLFSITTLVTRLSRIVPKYTQNMFDGKSSLTIFFGKSSLDPSHLRKSPVQKWATKTDGDHMDNITWMAVLAPESSDKGVSRKASKRVSCHQVAMVGSVRSLYLLFALQIWVVHVQLDLIGRWPDWPCLTLSSCSSTSTFHFVICRGRKKISIGNFSV